jgi:N,N-dimethylformamidase beta subunit-like, C-terminal/Fibronectin type III domain
VPTRYTTAVFADGFESGTLDAWNGPQGTGSVTVSGSAAHGGSSGAQITNTSGQFSLLLKTLPQPLQDSQTGFWARVSRGGSIQTLAQGRDSTSSQTVWSILYDPGKQGLYFYPTTGSGSSTEIFTGAGSVPVNTWFKVQVRFTAENPGGAQLYLDGQTSLAWGVSGNYSRASNYQRLQLWNDSTSTTYFDDVAVATTPPDTDSPPSAPSGLSGVARDGAVALTWTPPASDGGNPVTNYLVTPYISGSAQTAMVTTPSAQDSYTVTGLTNGTAYTFTVAAINGLGTGPASNVTPAITPHAASVPGVTTGLTGTARDVAVGLSWTAPVDDGGSTVTGYRVTPYVGGTAQTPILTGSPATTYTVSGLDNGTAYTFKVAAINKAGTGPDSSASLPVTPAPATVPGAPSGVQGIAQDGSVAVSWDAPSSDGGSPITAYRVTPHLGGAAQTPSTFASGATGGTVTGLTNGLAYTFTVAAMNHAGTGPESPASTAVTPMPPNPIQLENQQLGDPNWFSGVAPPNSLDIAGYASQISVNHGGSLDLYVTTTAASVSIDVFRMGWYNGAGARLMDSMGSFPGVNQAQAQPDPTTGMVSENWTKTATLNVLAGWTSGVYLARLKASNGYTSYVMFVVRDDGGSEPILFQASTSTYQAYNAWGGTSLYNNNTNDTVWPYPHALKVSFDRPFLNGNGTGDFLRWEYPFLRWLEKNGYDTAYTTDTDTGTDANAITGHKSLLVVGHDEYWSQGQRQNVQNAIASGVNVAFFAGNEAWWQVRYEPNAGGARNRVMDGYKDFAECSCDGGPDPAYGVNNSLVTTNFRNSPVNQPEDAMMGVMFGGEAVNAPYIVTDASSWVFAGTGWTNGTSVPGIVGYEYDHYFGDSTTPAGTTVLSNTPVTNTENGQPDTANSTLYTAPSGATVFAAGTIQWSWGLDGWYSSGSVNSGIQQATTNILQKFTGQADFPGGFGGN